MIRWGHGGYVAWERKQINKEKDSYPDVEEETGMLRKKSWRVCGGLILPRVGGSEFELFSSNITRATKQRRMRWAGHVARMGEKRNAYRVVVGKS